MTKEREKITINFTQAQWKWFCEEKLGLPPGERPSHGLVAEYFRAGGSLLGMPEVKPPGREPNPERNPRRDYMREKKREERKRKLIVDK